MSARHRTNGCRRGDFLRADAGSAANSRWYGGASIADTIVTFMEMSLRAVDGVVIVDVAGRLTVDSCVERPLARMIERLLADGKRQFLLNFESTTHIDSM